MINPYGVQREYGLWLEEVERRQGQARGLAHEVGLARRRAAATEAELRRSLNPPPVGEGATRGRGRFALTGLLRAVWLRRRLRKTYA